MLATRVYEIVDRLSPIASIWLRRRGLDNLMWCYSSVTLLFKRDFASICQLWIRISCSESPGTWIVYILAAVVMSLFEKIVITPDMTLITMMGHFEKMIQELRIDELCRLSEWIYTNCRIEARRNNTSV